ncbi:MAG: cation:proton antiporter [Elusimicrobiales bacterium]|nr:cation:proton antiporter [Elusimicrobiales bacterium]
MHTSFLTDIAISIIISSLLALIMKFLKQPLIIGYISTGLILGPGIGLGIITNINNIELISEIGLIFLLFIIGTELKLKDMIEKGKDIIILSLSQTFVGFLIIFALIKNLNLFELSITEKLYLSFALNITSTLIVIKTLKDKFEIQTFAGKITIGILIFQDLVATLFLAFQKDFSNPKFYEIFKSISLTFLLLLFAFISSRYLFLKIISKNSNSIELVILLSIAYCFAISSLASLIGVSKEMGALIAGFSLGNSPYSQEIVIRITSIRDFFVTLFFVSLGLKLPHINNQLLLISFYIILIIIVSRFLSILIFYKILKIGIRPLFITSINLFPISEFSLVISSLGLSYKHISDFTSAIILITMIITSLISSYLINYSHQIYAFIARIIGIEKIDENFIKEKEIQESSLTDVLILGFNTLTAEIVKSIKSKNPLIRITVADFNAANIKILEKLGANWIYVDLSNIQSIKRLEKLNPPFIVSPMTNMILKGIDVVNLYLNVKSIFPKSKIIFLSETEEEQDRLSEAGAKVINKSKILTQRFIREIFSYYKKTNKNNQENLQN